MPGTVKSELLTYADRSHKCDSQEKVCWMLYLPLDKSHFITVLVVYNSYPILAIPIIGTIAIIFCYVLFIVIAHIREKKSGKY